MCLRARACWWWRGDLARREGKGTEPTELAWRRPPALVRCVPVSVRGGDGSGAAVRRIRSLIGKKAVSRPSQNIELCCSPFPLRLFDATLIDTVAARLISAHGLSGLHFILFFFP